jgi:uncharacterized cupin superfamily protein
VLSGCGVIVTNEGETSISAGMCAGFPSGTGNAHQIRNTGTTELIFWKSVIAVRVMKLAIRMMI